jgi:hypothetical protein
MAIASKVKDVLNFRISETEIPKYKLNEIPKLVIGAGIIGGGIYGIVRFLLNKKESDEMTQAIELRKEKDAHASAAAAAAASHPASAPAIASIAVPTTSMRGEYDALIGKGYGKGYKSKGGRGRYK